MSRLARRFGKRQIDDAFDDFGRQRGLARRTRLVAQQTIDALAHEALLPTPDNRLRQSRPLHDLCRAAAIGGGENDPGPGCVLLRTVAIPNDPIETSSILGRDFDDDACSHTQSMNQITPFGNPLNASLH
jgi:hypothetical protein